MRVLNKEGSLFNNKILAVCVLMVILATTIFFVYGSSTEPPIVIFNSPAINNTFTGSSLPSINITFNATFYSNANVTILNNTVNITIGGIYYNFSNLTCQYDAGRINNSLTCNVTLATSSLANGTYNITASASDNASGSSGTRTIFNYTVYSGPPKVLSVVLDDPSPVKIGVVTINITFDRVMNTTLNPQVIIQFFNGTNNRQLNATNMSLGQFFNQSFVNDTTNRRSVFTGYINITAADGTLDGTTGINISGSADILGNVMDANNSNTFVIDTNPPWVVLGSNGTNMSTATAFSFNFTDNVSSTAFCRLFVNRTDAGRAVIITKNWTVLNNTGTFNNGSLVNFSLSDSAGEGTFQYIVECNDTANNKINSTGAYLVNVDQTAPLVNASINSPQNGSYITSTAALPLSIVVNITDAISGLNNNKSNLWVAIYKNGGVVYNFSNHSDNTLNLSTEGSRNHTRINPNVTKAITADSVSDSSQFSALIYTRDYAGNSRTYNLTFNIDNTAPTIGVPTLDASSYAQGANFTMTVSINDSFSGVNYSRSNSTSIKASLALNTSSPAYTSLGIVDLNCSGTSTAMTCYYSYNTSTLPPKTYNLNGTIFAADNAIGVASGALANNATASVSLNFTVTNVGAPTIISVVSNLSSIVNDTRIPIYVNVTVNDSSGVNAVWLNYTNATGNAKCILFEGGNASNTTFSTNQSCSILANSSASMISNNLLTLSIYANDTTGSTSDATTYSLKVEQDFINVTAFTLPSKPFVNSTITINTTVFSWNGTPTGVMFYATNSTSGNVSLQAPCTVADARAKLYYCVNTTNTNVLAIFATNVSTVTIVNASFVSDTNDSNLPSPLTMTFYSNITVPVNKLSPTATLKFLDSGATISGSGIDGGANTSAAVQDIEIRDSAINNSVIILNNINTSAIANFSFEIVVANATGTPNATNWTYVQNSLTTSTAALLTAIVIQPLINNASSGFTGSTIAFNCTSLNISCSSTTRVYKAAFNTSTNRTLSSDPTWTVITAENTAFSDPILTVTVDSFSIFALATPVSSSSSSSSTSTSSSSSGGGGGIGYKLVGKVTAFDLIDMIRDFYKGVSKKTAFDIIDSIRKFYAEGTK